MPNPWLLDRLTAVNRGLVAVLMILLVLLVAIPLGMGMAMGACPDSQMSLCPSVAGTCAAIVGLLVLVLIMVLGTIRDRAALAPSLLLVRSLDRPPRFVL
jgi:hypothetical protein